MKITVDLEKCHMSGECYYNHPELFAMGEQGYPVVLIGEIQDEAIERQAREAIEVCPAVAIALEGVRGEAQR